MKRALAVLLSVIFALSFSIVYAGTYTDIEGNQYSKAIENLSQMDIISGYEDGTYKPDNSISRAEMAKLLVSMLKVDMTNVDATTSAFKDVPTWHWAIKYINVASKEGLIKGNGEGYFRPDDTVTYAEASTMIIRLLGYDDIEGIGTWPDNYLTRANELGILSNVSRQTNTSPANRGSVAQMLDNSVKKVYTRPEYPIVKMANSLFDKYDELTSGELYKEQYGGKITAKNKITAKLEVKGDYLTDEVKTAQSIINNSELKLLTNADIPNEFMQIIATYLYKNKEVAEGEVVIKGEDAYFSIKDVFEKYIKEDLGVSPFENTSEELTDVDKMRLEIYKDAIINLITSGKVKVQGTTLKINGKTENVTKASITIDEITKKEMEIYVTQRKLKNDAILLDEYGHYIETYAKYSTKKNYTLETVKEEVRKDIADLEDELTALKNGTMQNTYYTYSEEVFNIDLYLKDEEVVGTDIQYIEKTTGIDYDEYYDNYDKYGSYANAPRITKTSMMNINVVISGENIYAKYSIDAAGEKAEGTLDAVKDSKGIVNSRFTMKYYEENELKINLTLNISSEEILGTDFNEPDVSGYITEVDDKTRERLEEKIEYIMKQWDLFDEYKAYKEEQERKAKQLADQLEALTIKSHNSQFNRYTSLDRITRAQLMELVSKIKSSNINNYKLDGKYFGEYHVSLTFEQTKDSKVLDSTGTPKYEGCKVALENANQPANTFYKVYITETSEKGVITGITVIGYNSTTKVNPITLPSAVDDYSYGDEYYDYGSVIGQFDTLAIQSHNNQFNTYTSLDRITKSQLLELATKVKSSNENNKEIDDYYFGDYHVTLTFDGTKDSETVNSEGRPNYEGCTAAINSASTSSGPKFYRVSISKMSDMGLIVGLNVEIIETNN